MRRRTWVDRERVWSSWWAFVLGDGVALVVKVR